MNPRSCSVHIVGVDVCTLQRLRSPLLSPLHIHRRCLAPRPQSPYDLTCCPCLPHVNCRIVSILTPGPDPRPPNLTSLAPPTQGPSATPMPSIAKLIMHRHVRIAFFRFPFVNLADIASRLSHCFSTYSNVDLDPPCLIVSAMHSRRHAFLADLSLQHRPLSTLLISARQATGKQIA